MNTQKLNEALVEMKHQRALLDAAIKNIEGVLTTLAGNASEAPVASRSRSYQEGSYIDLAEQILAEAGKPMHIAEIAKKIGELRGKAIPRPSVESSVIRHIKIYGDKSRIVKVRPAYFGLPAWKTLFVKPAQHSAA